MHVTKIFHHKDTKTPRKNIKSLVIKKEQAWLELTELCSSTFVPLCLCGKSFLQVLSCAEKRREKKLREITHD
jgi:hypothetical protein